MIKLWKIENQIAGAFLIGIIYYICLENEIIRIRCLSRSAVGWERRIRFVTIQKTRRKLRLEWRSTTTACCNFQSINVSLGIIGICRQDNITSSLRLVRGFWVVESLFDCCFVFLLRLILWAPLFLRSLKYL